MKKIFSYIIIIGIVGLLIYSYINIRILTYTKKYTLNVEDAPSSQVALILGALVYSNGNVSPILKDRLDYGIELYKSGKVKKLLLSGDHGRKNYDEVNSMREYVLSKGVKPEDVFMDHAGFSTYDSMYRSRDVFNVDKMIIVTQEFHLPRAIYIARKLNVDAYGVKSDMHFYPKLKYYKFRESIARCKDYINVNILKKKPTYLGEPIDITTDGRVTNDKE